MIELGALIILAVLTFWLWGNIDQDDNPDAAEQPVERDDDHWPLFPL